MSSPWKSYPEYPGHWDTAAHPYVVRWSVATGDRLTRWSSRIRHFATLEEAVAAYKRPFSGLFVDLVAFNGGPPGRHVDTLARRRRNGPTKWADAVPKELRA